MLPLELKSYFYGNTNRLHITGARSQLTGGGVLNSLTGTAQLMDKNLAAIPGEAPVTLNYIAASQGEYEAVFDENLDPAMKRGSFINVLIILEAGANLKYRGVLQAKIVENAA